MEINEIVKAVKLQDNAAFETLLEQFRKMIYSIINIYEMEYGDYQICKDDLFQEATIGLYEAALSFNDDRNVMFSTFAYTVIKRRVHRFYRIYRSEYENSSCSLDKIELQDHNTLFKSDVVNESTVNYSYEQLLKEKIENGRTIMSEQDRAILLLRMNNYSYDEISKKLNIKKKRIDNRLTRLKRHYLKNDSK